MFLRFALLTFALWICAAAVLAQTAGSLPSDAEIRQILAARIDVQKQAVGIVVGVIDEKGRRIVAYGHPDKDDARPIDPGAVFEIGSMTKVFTSLVLMDMVQKSEVSLDDPVAKFLPANVKVPERAGRKITLRDLSTQSSGLPRLPDNLHPKDPSNPYADYTPEMLYQFLSGYRLTRDIGEKYEYSNLGVGLLGLALARRNGTDYETMVRTRVLKPLEMNETAIALSPALEARLVPGHDGNLRRVANWDLPTFAGAGALRSTASDMLTFLAANLGFVKTPLAAAMATEVSVHRPTGMPDVEIAYGWHLFTAHGKTIYWHNGGTGGYRSFMGYDPRAKVAVVALTNTSTTAGVDDIGHHLLDAAFPLATFEPPREHKQITLESKALDAFSGQYQLAPNFILTVTHEGDRLFGQATGQGKFELFAEDGHTFFAKITELTITFETGADGKATSLTLKQMGNTIPARRIGDAPAK